MKTIIFLQYAKFWKYYSVLGEIQLEFLWHTAFRASEDYVRGVSHGMVHGGSAPSDAHDCRSEDCEGQLASQPTHEGTVWHVALQRQQVGQAFVDGLSFSSIPYHLRLKVYQRWQQECNRGSILRSSYSPDPSFLSTFSPHLRPKLLYTQNYN